MRLLSILAIVMAVSFGCAFAEVSQSIEVMPVAREARNSIQFDLSYTRWPDFFKWEQGNACGPVVDQNYSNKRRAPTGGGSNARPGYFGYWDDFDPNDPNKQIYYYVPQASEYTTLLSYTFNFADEGLADYMNSAKISVLYQVRLEGEIFVHGMIRPHANWFCDGFTGKSWQSFEKGQAYIRLFVNGQPYGSATVMTIPRGGVSTIDYKVDPTIGGDFVLEGPFNVAPYNGKVIVELKVYNDTCMNLNSPAETSNIIFEVSPTG